MSKSMGTGVFLNMSPDEMFTKIMQQPDENIPQLYTDCTYKTLKEIEEMKLSLRSNLVNPRDIKLNLAVDIVSIYHGSEEALETRDRFVDLYTNRIVPKDTPTYLLTNEKNILDILVRSGLSDSNTKARKDIEQKTIKVDQNIIGIDFNIYSKEEYILQKGKKDFVKVVKKVN
jgi:tyrosyl-tRNA synthetase